MPVRPSMWHWTSVCERVGCESFIIAWLCAVGYVSFIIMRVGSWLMRTAVDVEVLRAGVDDGGEERDEEQVDC